MDGSWGEEEVMLDGKRSAESGREELAPGSRGTQGQKA